MTYIDQVRQTFIAQGNAIADQINQAEAKEFVEAAENWAKNVGRGVAQPKPEAAFKVKAVTDTSTDSWKLEIVVTDEKVSTVDPSSFLPTYNTDTNAVGGPVGGPIPGKPGKFYAASGSVPYVGQYVEVFGRKFVYAGTSPFDKFFQEIS